MLSEFFIKRPVFAWVIAILIMLGGCLAIYKLPVSQYPPIAPPSIYIQASYPGASAETVENSVTQIIEQKMTGLDNMIYLSSTSDSSGSVRVELTFSTGTDPDLAWAKVQNKLQLAMTSLPEVVQQGGITVGKATMNYFLIVGLISEDGSMSNYDLNDYAQSNLEKSLARIPGVGEVSSFGSQYAMRIWLDPNKLNGYDLTIEDVVTSLKSYNVEVSAGQLGGLPAKKGQRLNSSIIVQTLLKNPEDFAAIPIRTRSDGSAVVINDVGRVELGSGSYDSESRYNGKPAAGIAIRQLAGANALDTANAVKAKIDELSEFFPTGMKAVYPIDTTPFIKTAIYEVVKTLIIAILLVVLIIYLFTGNLRATLIPTIAVPIVLLGTFGVMSIFGFSINMLTMLAMVLAIGLLVDDAIVVVENVERIMADEGLSPKEATSKSMGQITSALIGIGLVLSAVFGPMAFFGGSTGVIYRQFSVTMITSMLLSVVVALILTPVLCASLLKPEATGHKQSGGPLHRFFTRFDNVFFQLRNAYVKIVERSFSQKMLYVIIYLVIVMAVGVVFMRIPTGYLPDEDQGQLMAQVSLPAGATLEQTEKVLKQAEDYFMTDEKAAVAACMTIAGTGFSGTTQSAGMIFVRLKDWKDRDKPALKAKAVVDRAMVALSKIKNAQVFVFMPPPISELSNIGGFDFELLDQGGLGHKKLMEAKDQLLSLAAKDKRLSAVRFNGIDDVSQYRVDVDWKKAGALQVPIDSIHNTISDSFGSVFVNNFVQGSRVKRVFAQFDTDYRMVPEDLENIYVANKSNKMVPFSAFASARWTSGPQRLERYNGFPSINIVGENATGASSGEAMQAMKELVAKLPRGIGYAWTGLSYQEQTATSQTMILYIFSVIVIFLCVAALYESWTIPIANLLMLPLGLFGAALATSLRGLHNDVYFQIGFLTTLGLTTKNAILIIQFAREQMAEGVPLIKAALEAARLRLRPVIMTSLAFFFGVLPLVFASGAGAGGMKAIGTAVAGGMLSATFIDLFFIPLSFVLVSRFFSKKKTTTESGNGGSPPLMGKTTTENETAPVGGVA
jgi:hydrophobe/amphiphile efflux-1 (HAE1) family protein